MFYSNINDIRKYNNLYPQRILEALDYLQKNDFTKIEAGKHEINGEKMFAVVVDLTTTAMSEQKPESHKKYIDVQYLVYGSEMIGVAHDAGKNPIVEAASDRDCYYYDQVDNEIQLPMSAGDFAVFFPFDIHRPGCQRGAAMPIRKVVIKVAVDSL